jgi:phytoene dehydrogenase-like protein
VSPLIEVFCGYALEEIGLPVVALAADSPGPALTVRAGMGALAVALAGDLDVKYGQRVRRVNVEESPRGVRVAALDDDGREVVYRPHVVVIATLADAALELWPGAPDGTRRFLESTIYSNDYVVHLRTREPFEKLDRRGDGLYMEVIPTRPGCALHALVFQNCLAPEGGLLAASATPAARRSLDEETLAARIEAELVQLHPELRGQIVDRRGVRTPKVVPHFPAGRARELHAFRSGLTAGPVQLAGDYLYGPSWRARPRPDGQRPTAHTPTGDPRRRPQD